MKINAFQIKNYRSIVDSRKSLLSPDHITALIGQNESGKTSVLEALKSFYEGAITDDVLRSDLTFPEIICTFSLDEGKTLADLLDLTLPENVRSAVSGRTEVSVKRKWLNSRHSVITLAEKEILDFYISLEGSKIASTDKILASIPELTRLAEITIRETELSENEVTEARKKIIAINSKVEEIRRQISRSKSPDDRITAEQELAEGEEKLTETENLLKEKLSALTEKKTTAGDLDTKLNICRLFSEQLARLKSIQNELKEKADFFRDLEFQYKISKSDREAKLIAKRLDQIIDLQNRLNSELNSLQSEICRNRKIADKVLSGTARNEAETEAKAECEKESSYATPESLGAAIWKHLPVFEFFEDFSSLLPNKIDLDDLLHENTHAEGYKAARNFLFVAGLNAEFFREENHRILKQKIENLNTEITVDFQDYWRQSVGKDDKIRINFELEHYDNSQPEKSGKPYLEFWVKDKQERLYPKQRSRGVRWFLSFYLELKATAKSNTLDRVMLIDEPGLSLHARAQEDVLKVFDDLSQHLQIIYCTHSPNLIDLKKLYRIIAVQRAKDSDETSETIILDSRSLCEASSDTLSPVYALMGTRLNDRQFVFPRNNFIVEDSVTFHYFEVMSMLYGFEPPVHYIPASGADLVPTLANMLFGWKINFGVILTDNSITQQVTEKLLTTTFFANGSAKRFINLKGVLSVEDLFSTIDFKRFILKQRAGITVKNSEYIDVNKLSRIIMVSDFHSRIREENIQFSDFDEETRSNFENLFALIKNSMETD